MVHTKTEVFCVLRPSSVPVSGLLECVKHAFSSHRIALISAALCPKLVDFGRDGAAINVPRHGALVDILDVVFDTSTCH